MCSLFFTPHRNPIRSEVLTYHYDSRLVRKLGLETLNHLPKVTQEPRGDSFSCSQRLYAKHILGPQHSLQGHTVGETDVVIRDLPAEQFPLANPQIPLLQDTDGRPHNCLHRGRSGKTILRPAQEAWRVTRMVAPGKDATHLTKPAFYSLILCQAPLTNTPEFIFTLL